MDQADELEKYKKLLDSGAITEEEFRLLKQQLLGLKTDAEKEAERETERAEALKEIDAMREKEKTEAEEAERQKREEEAKAADEQREREIQESKEKATHAYSEEKAREKARLDAEQEHENELMEEKRHKAQNTAKTVGSGVKSVILWAACAFLIFLGIGSLMVMDNIFYILLGIVCLILAAIACPLITSKTKDIPALAAYYQMKIPIVIALVVLAFVFTIYAGSTV